MTSKEFDARVEATPDKIEWTGGIFTSERERLLVLAMLVELLGIDRVVELGNIQDWKDAIAAREASEAGPASD